VIVDHETSVGDCIADVLKRAGYDACVFGDAGAALEHIETEGRDVALVLTDQALPQVSGEQFAERLYAQIDAPPVVIMVGYAERAERYRTSILKKPFRVAELLDVVESAARHRSVHARRRGVQ